ncbi:serine/threonine-protein kinase [Mycolicibacterium neoaurum]|uniref:serine/threonine-protein kinase n=1 Tax=Mycolicibacterium neoaurum TaxID=1795 RepID=UPI00248C79F7|nr:serine/threonine-protein kinase [Mycolicibacterium neoaurum]WBP95238.1 serine/threonine-protein kinase [Mycolicibacterium neoaurum]WBS08464.1 serine/threonine-protein kinase [Mycolicibacterium neoaurum]
MQQPLGGRYELRGLLGRGGMAAVHDGWDTRLGRPVAIKLMDPTAGDRRRFESEARAVATLNHPNIVAVHDSGEHGGLPYLVMERLPGRTLADVFAAGPVPAQQVRALLCELLAGLAAAHAAGILHRDIKPANILVTAADGIKIADFGIAKSPTSAHTMTGQVVGTLGYLSPQRLAGHPATVADDLYAAAMVAAEGLVGRIPLPHENLAALRPDADAALVTVIQRALAADERVRFAGAEQMLAALSARPGTLVLDQPLPDPATVRVAVPRPRSRRRRVLAMAGGVVALLVLLAAFLVDTASRNGTPTPAPIPSSNSSPAPVSSVSAPPVLSTTAAPAPAPAPGPAGGPGRGNGGNGKGDKGPKPKPDR